MGGDPAFWMQDGGTEILVGITSWGDRNCKAPGFKHRVDITGMLSFMDGEIADLQQKWARCLKNRKN